jgi:hypothetical protein
MGVNFLIFREEHVPRVFVDRVLKRIFSPKKGNAVGLKKAL